MAQRKPIFIEFVITLYTGLSVTRNTCYYMASSVSGQHELNPVMWLATQAGKMELSRPLRAIRHVPQENFCKSDFMDLDSVLVHKHAKKELGQYPAILTSHLINNPYLWLSMFDGSLMLQVNWPVVQTIHPLSNKFYWWMKTYWQSWNMLNFR